jgi:cytoskeletal protein CcmA (bactofilin family)
MFSTNTKEKPANEKISAASVNGSRESSDTCLISPGTVIEGKFSSSENIRVDGLIKGEVKCSQRLVMGENGKIEGNVRTKDAVIMGTIEGEVYAEGTLHLKGAGLIRGIIQAKYMTVEEGARYVGECKIGV